jgi:hypothetical protein
MSNARVEFLLPVSSSRLSALIISYDEKVVATIRSSYVDGVKWCGDDRVG